ncbi:microbial collagenase [Microbulbifer donghaiensis]|uniref:Microbial collagenase n=1 Tax=Microbulbifer donghaiensis TaxID=494016 RepID=A0A1M4YIN2_9GAMM|nr:collagenase [Microbulbifer donghaiensis]SHF05382.1 microbial collagenase [Microbulbifer donghaiensis]
MYGYRQLTLLSTHICLALALVALSACAQKSDRSPEITALLNPQSDFWQAGQLHSPAHFRAAVSELNRLLADPGAEPQALDRLLYYLRAYSYFGPLEPLDDLHWLALDRAMQELSAHPAFSAHGDFAARLQEHFAVTLYRYYDRDVLAGRVAAHLPTVAAILQRYRSGDLSRAEQFSLWENFRALGFLAYNAKSLPAIKHALTEEFPLTAALLAFVRSENADRFGDAWPLRHSLWVLGNLHALLEQEKAGQLDEQVWATLSRDLHRLDDIARRELFTTPYLVSSYRGKSACDENFPERCVFPEEHAALPITHSCSASLIIRANSISDTELEQTCRQLLSREDSFHRQLASDRKPVADDHNRALEVVVFDNYSQYNRYGQLLFDIRTDNGGMFLEGEPDQEENQARFIAFETFWKEPEFGIWNLQHEYVHYLDGRFNKYGAFGHFPSHLVWWSEGLANYIAHGDDYDGAARDLAGSRPSTWPTLGEIFTTEYADGTARVYSWSYLAIRFLQESDTTALPRLAAQLRTDNFEGYRQTLDHMAADLQPQFHQWLQHQSEQLASDEQTEQLPRQLYRYLYRDYLQPVNLALDEQHRHRG